MLATGIEGKTALVFGANGISGAALITQLIQTSTSEWSKVIAISRRPPQLKELNDDPRIIFASADILNVSVKELTRILIDHGAKEAQHAFYYTYCNKPPAGRESTLDVNMELLTKTLQALVATVDPPVFESFVLQTGYSYYGTASGPPYLAKAPFVEDTDDDVLRSNKAFNSSYYPQEDLIKSFCQEQNWRWIISRPNVIMGVSKYSLMNFAVSLAIYASLQKCLGRKLEFPGCKERWTARDDISTATNNADFQVWASLNKEAGNNVFNTADGPKTLTSHLWHKIAEYFGLEVVSEDEIVSCKQSGNGEHDIRGQTFALQHYMEQNKGSWDKIAEKHNLDIEAFDYGTWVLVDAWSARSWADDGSLDKMRKFGWNKTFDSIQGIYKVFDTLKEMNIIPK